MGTWKTDQTGLMPRADLSLLVKQGQIVDFLML